MFIRILILTMMLGAFSFSVRAQETGAEISQEKRKLILEFIDVIGTRKGLEDSFKDILTRATPEQKIKVQGLLNVDAVIEELIPLYDKHFDENELRSYIEFYKSQSGQKLLTTLPEIMQESIEVSTKFFQKKLSVPAVSTTNN